jgi:endonuclease YncB( thermonuclease family)
MIARVAGILLCMALTALPVIAQNVIATVVEVAEADVLVVKDAQGEQRVRLFAVDAPESAQPYAPEAKAWVVQQALNKDVLLTFKESAEEAEEDALPLVVAVLPDGQNLNETLVVLGYAWAYDRHIMSARLKDLQVKAMQAKKGLWQDPAPLAPWDYREKHRAEVAEQEADTSRYADLKKKQLSTPNAHVSVSEDDVLELKVKGKDLPAAAPQEYPSSTTATPPTGRSSVLQDNYRPKVLREPRAQNYDNVQILRTDPDERPRARPDRNAP